MDEMRISSKFTTGILSKLLERVIRKKFGFDVTFNLNEVDATISNGKAQIHLDAFADVEKDELTKLLEMVGL